MAEESLPSNFEDFTTCYVSVLWGEYAELAATREPGEPFLTEKVLEHTHFAEAWIRIHTFEPGDLPTKLFAQLVPDGLIYFSKTENGTPVASIRCYLKRRNDH